MLSDRCRLVRRAVALRVHFSIGSNLLPNPLRPHEEQCQHPDREEQERIAHSIGTTSLRFF
jgi:hypothetical protein